jgi:hypothetical protein
MIELVIMGLCGWTIINLVWTIQIKIAQWNLKRKQAAFSFWFGLMARHKDQERVM